KTVDKISKCEAVHQIVPRSNRVSVDKRKNSGRIYDCQGCLKRSRRGNVCRLVVKCLQPITIHWPRNHLADLLMHARLLFEHHSTFRLDAGVNRLGDLSTPEDIDPKLSQNGLFISLYDWR